MEEAEMLWRCEEAVDIMDKECYLLSCQEGNKQEEKVHGLQSVMTKNNCGIKRWGHPCISQYQRSLYPINPIECRKLKSVFVSFVLKYI